jgi:hypothetical protein
MMDNNIYIKVPVKPELWSMFAQSMVQNVKQLTDTMDYYRSDESRYNIEDLQPMRQQCEQILESCGHVYDDITQMITQAYEIQELGYKNEEWWHRQGEHEMNENKL